MGVFFLHDTATTDIYTYGPTLSLHDALPVFGDIDGQVETLAHQRRAHRVLAALVELVQFAQHRQLAVALDPLPLEAAAQQLAMVEPDRSEEHTSELQSLMRISYAVFCLEKKKQTNIEPNALTQ